MKNIKSFLFNIKNLLPYLSLIAIYFFFVNLEARNDDTSYRNYLKVYEDKNNNNQIKTANNNKIIKISIPVIPYEK